MTPPAGLRKLEMKFHWYLLCSATDEYCPKKTINYIQMVVMHWMAQLQPVRLYLVLTITTLFFLTQMIVSHVTHSLTLLVDSYHVLCNLIALIGCIVTIKNVYSRTSLANTMEESRSATQTVEELKSLQSLPSGETKINPIECNNHPEHQLRNTFGWARIDVLVSLIGCVFQCSLCFSVLIEAFQTLLHISHHDEMHRPILVLTIAAAGLGMNALCYALIGGFTNHQGRYLCLTPDGNVVLEETTDAVGDNLKKSLPTCEKHSNMHLTVWKVATDNIGCLLVITCSVLVYFTEEHVAKFVDPLLSILSSILILLFSYPYMRNCSLILLQTIPEHINIESLSCQLLKAFPDIVNVHDFHIWQLSLDKTFSTVHIIFLNPQDYTRNKTAVTDFFHMTGITHVTIQPEFFKDSNSLDLVSGYGVGTCLMQCNRESCFARHCCDLNSELKVIGISSQQLSSTNALESIESPFENDKNKIDERQSHCEVQVESDLRQVENVVSVCSRQTTEQITTNCGKGLKCNLVETTTNTG